MRFVLLFVLIALIGCSQPKEYEKISDDLAKSYIHSYRQKQVDIEKRTQEIMAQNSYLKSLPEPTKDEPQLTLDWLENRSYQADLVKAIGKEDCRFIGIMGYSMHLPGLPQDNSKYEYYREKYGAYAIAGTGCVRPPSTDYLYDLAQQYATNYNKMLIEYINSGISCKIYCDKEHCPWNYL